MLSYALTLENTDRDLGRQILQFRSRTARIVFDYLSENPQNSSFWEKGSLNKGIYTDYTQLMYWEGPSWPSIFNHSEWEKETEYKLTYWPKEGEGQTQPANSWRQVHKKLKEHLYTQDMIHTGSYHINDSAENPTIWTIYEPFLLPFLTFFDE